MLAAYARGTTLFSVYDSNTDKLGLFRNEHARVIVRAYTLAKGHMESINAVQDESRSFTHRVPEYAATDNPIGKTLLAQLQRYQDRVGPMLQKESTDVLNAWSDAITLLIGFSPPGTEDEPSEW